MELESILTPNQVAFYSENATARTAMSSLSASSHRSTPEAATHLRMGAHALAERLMERHTIDSTWNSARAMQDKRP